MSGEDFLPRGELESLQFQRLVRLLEEVLPRNPFYREKLAAAGLSRHDLQSLADLQRLPFTTKAELQIDQEQHPPYGTNLTYPLEEYQRLHQTSGTHGNPLRWLDTRESWRALIGCWLRIFGIVGVQKKDCLLFPFSFGPFLGFWTAFEAGLERGCLCLPAGGMGSGARLRMLLDNRADFVFTTPTYAMRLAEVAREQGIELSPDTPGYRVRGLIVAGEPGGSIPATRQRLQEAWRARVYDHSGMTEVGPLAIECEQNPAGLHILESDYLTEIVDPATLQPVPQGQVGELVVTTLVRLGSPLLRYRTGDLVRAAPPCPCGRCYLRLEGGILGRTDDMISIRGNNLFPSALEGLLRRFPEVAEFRVSIDASSSLTELRVEIEPAGSVDAVLAGKIEEAIRNELMFRAEVTLVPASSLPRFEMKAQRFVRRDGPDKPG